jgi:hypothetical protein
MSQASNHYPQEVLEAQFFYAIHDIFRTREEREDYQCWLDSLSQVPPQTPGHCCQYFPLPTGE